MSLLTALSADLQKNHRAALRRYGELLAAPESDKAVKELKQLMAALDKSEADVHADATLMQEVVQSLQPKIAAATPDLPQRREAATLAAYDAETAALLRDRRAGYAKRYEAMRTLDAIAGAAGTAQSRLDHLLSRNPDLLSFARPG